MTRERIDELVSLVLEARGREGYSVSICIGKNEESIYIYTVKAESGINFTTYTTHYFYNVEGKRVLRNQNRLNVYDADLKKAETRIRRLLDDVDR